MRKLCMALTACAMLFAAGCAAEAEPAMQRADTARHVTSASPEVTVEQIINEYNSSRRAVAAPVNTVGLFMIVVSFLLGLCPKPRSRTFL